MKVRLTAKELYFPNNQEKLVGYWRSHPVICAQDIFNVDLIWFQRIAAKAFWEKSAIFFLFGRGIGKTWLLALLSSMFAMLFPGTKIGYYTPTAKQWEVFWDYIAEFMDNCPLFANSIKVEHGSRPIRNWRGTVRTVFKNSSRIESLALNEKSRGRRNDIAIFDEYKDHDIHMINTIALPFLSTQTHKYIENKQIYATTGFYTWNHAYLKYVFYKYKELLGDNSYCLLEHDHRDIDILEESPYRMSYTVREQIRQEPSMTEDKFNMEMYCKIAKESDAVFTYRLLDSPRVTPKGEDAVDICTEGRLDRPLRPDENRESAIRAGAIPKSYVMGIDNARVVNGDNFALQILELEEDSRVGKLVYSLALNGTPLPTQALKIFHLVKVFNIVRIFIDNDSYGKSLKDLLASGCKQYDVPPLLDIDDKIHKSMNGRHIIRMFNFTVPNIMEMFDKLKSALEDGRLQFPVDLRRHEDQKIIQISLEIQRTKRELVQLQLEPRQGGFVYVVPSGKKRDRAMALGLANMANVDVHYMDLVNKPKTIETTGAWA